MLKRLRYNSQKRVNAKIFPFFIKYAFRSALKTKSFAADPASQTEIHSLVCHKDMHRYLYCIKSLLTYIHKCPVVVHDDGSLTGKDKLRLKEHIKGVKIYSPAEANRIVLPKIQKYPLLKKIRSQYVLAKKITDFSLLSKTGKIIALDSDILFLSRPKDLIQWAQSDKKEALLSDESPHNSYQDKYLPKTPFKYIPSLNSGLICYYTDMLDFELAEKVFELPMFHTDYRDHGIGDQPFMAVNFGEAKHNKNYPVRMLSPYLYVNNARLCSKNAIAKHYWLARASLKAMLAYLMDKKRVHKSIKI